MCHTVFCFKAHTPFCAFLYTITTNNLLRKVVTKWITHGWNYLDLNKIHYSTHVRPSNLKKITQTHNAHTHVYTNIYMQTYVPKYSPQNILLSFKI